jgi:hypothetical protein
VSETVFLLIGEIVVPWILVDGPVYILLIAKIPRAIANNVIPISL